MSYIGPQLPPHLQSVQNDNHDDSDSEDDAYGPALPPHLQQKLKENPSDSIPSGSSSGPCLYPNSVERKPTFPDVEESDSSDGEIVGPLPPGEATGHEDISAAELERRALKMKRKLLGQDGPEDKEPQRETWMLELPELKRKNFGLGPRQFNRTDKPEIKGRDQWTSTPGSDKRSAPNDEKDEDKEKVLDQYLEQKRNKELEKIVEKHDKGKRSKSLLNAHQEERKKKKKLEEAIPKERKPFDRDTDLKANQMDDAKRKALIKRSQELNSKFKIGNQKFL